MDKLPQEEIVFIDPLTDFGFKKIFGTDPNKDLLISFLNGIFQGRKHIESLIYNKNEHLGDNKEEGSAIFDLLCTGKDGERFIIEVQRARQGNFKKRALFYTSRLISDQAPKGNRSGWDYNVQEVYLIALLEGFTLENSSPSAYLHDICLCNRDSREIFYEGLGYIYLELVKFVKEEGELDTDLDKWLYVLKNMSRMKKIPLYLRKTIFEKLFNIAEYSNLSKEEKIMYDSSRKQKWDNENALKYAVMEGEHKKAIAIALEMKKDGMSVEQIARFTKLPKDEINKL